ncbi:unnamed protein product [Meloidogyne enterolobii]|uniref:Uncharacterized protein n=1 Tax=Meloidogyne enterolobii TaxID=390850 RepID=A0ACB0Y5F4_MELEN
MFIDIALAPVEEGWLIGPNYILPHGCHFRLGTEVLAKSNSKIARSARAYGGEWRFSAVSNIPRIFRITKRHTLEKINSVEEFIEAALIVIGEEKKRLKWRRPIEL